MPSAKQMSENKWGDSLTRFCEDLLKLLLQWSLAWKRV